MLLLLSVLRLLTVRWAGRTGLGELGLGLLLVALRGHRLLLELLLVIAGRRWLLLVMLLRCEWLLSGLLSLLGRVERPLSATSARRRDIRTLRVSYQVQVS